MKRRLTVLLTLSLLGSVVPVARSASLREKVFTGFSGDQIFAAAVKAARANYMVTRVDAKNMTFVFHTDVTLTDNFDWTASVEKTEGGVRLVLNVPSHPDVLMSSSGERIAEQLFEATVENLAKEDIIECRALPNAERTAAAF